VDSEVFSCLPRVEPIVAVALVCPESYCKLDSNSLGEPIDELVDKRIAQTSLVGGWGHCPFRAASGSWHGDKPQRRRLIMMDASRRLALE
jgi:hypothetical protein